MMCLTNYQGIEALFILVAAAFKTMVLSCEIVIVALWEWFLHHQPSAPHHHDQWAP
jgi:hypothetical protein